MLRLGLCLLVLGSVLLADEKPVAPDASPKRIKQLIRQLGSPTFKEREAAERALIELGLAAEKQVQRAMEDDDPEIARRAGAVYRVLPVIPEIKRATEDSVSELLEKHPPAKFVKRYTERGTVQLLQGGKPVGCAMTIPKLEYGWEVEHACSVVSPDGRFWAHAQHYEAAKAEDVTDVIVWNIHTGKIVAKQHYSHWVKEMAFSADGRKLLCHVYDDMRSGK